MKAILYLHFLMGLLLVAGGCASVAGKRNDAGEPSATNEVRLQPLRTIPFEKLQARMEQPRPHRSPTNYVYKGPPGLRAYGETNLHYFVNLANELFRFALKPDGSPEKISIRDLLLSNRMQMGAPRSDSRNGHVFLPDKRAQAL